MWAHSERSNLFPHADCLRLTRTRTVWLFIVARTVSVSSRQFYWRNMSDMLIKRHRDLVCTQGPVWLLLTFCNPLQISWRSSSQVIITYLASRYKEEVGPRTPPYIGLSLCESLYFTSKIFVWHTWSISKLVGLLLVNLSTLACKVEVSGHNKPAVSGEISPMITSCSSSKILPGFTRSYWQEIPPGWF